MDTTECAQPEEVALSALEGVRIGNAEDADAATGVTVIIFPKGAPVGVDVSGGGPASRESALLSPLSADTPVNAIVLSGGSAYGLAASNGVMRWLEERGIGFDTGVARVPIVVQSCLYDLTYGSSAVRPDAAMGRAACEAAWAGAPVENGSFGAGATVGKLGGMRRSMKSGLGVCAVRLRGLVMAAVVAVNALGDICDERTGTTIAGLLNAERSGFADSRTAFYALDDAGNLFAQTNTTIGAILTNAAFSKAQLSKLAAMTRNAYARCIRPAGKLVDGDTIYAASLGMQKADLNLAGVLAADVMSRAIVRAVTAARMDDGEYLARCL